MFLIGTREPPAAFIAFEKPDGDRVAAVTGPNPPAVSPILAP
ncbi:MAG: hypothetical protein OXH94_06135 [Rhodospirillales bacterium]|nr:hypothetical protein [Rhodospirillales bacterium]